MITIAAGAGGAAVAWAACRMSARAARPAAVPAGPCAVVTALGWAWLGWRWSVGGLPAWWLPVPLAVFAVAAPLAAADLRYRRLPDVLTAATAVLVGAAVMVCAAEVGAGVLVRSVAGAAGFTGAHAVVRALSPRSLGAGDVKLAVGLGGGAGAVGWPALVVTAVVASLVTLAGACAAGWIRRAAGGRRDRGVPHGPGMLLGACLVVAFLGAALDTGPAATAPTAPTAAAAPWAPAVTAHGVNTVMPGPG